MKRYLIWIAKIGISAAILSYLGYKTWQDGSFHTLVEKRGELHWGLLAGAVAAAWASIMVSFVRWYLLVRALGLPFALRDAIRLGFIGHFFSFLTLGMVGGDLLKSIFIAHEQPGRRTEGVASVIIDRVIGLYALFLMASLAYFVSDLTAPNVVWVCRFTVGLMVVGTCGLALLLAPGFTTMPLWEKLAGIPKVGGLIQRGITALRIYRSKPLVLGLSLLMSMGVHGLTTLSVYLVVLGLPGEKLSPGTLCVIVPIAMVANAVPLPGGLGGMEAALDFLYHSAATEGETGWGFVIAVAYRLITVLLALVGVAYYLAGRRQVEALIHESEEEAAASVPS